MCQYTTSPNFYENCKVNTGWNGSPHSITVKIIWQCEMPCSDTESGEVCAERLQTERGQVQGDKVKTKLPGDCPVCKAICEAIEKASTENYVMYYNPALDQARGQNDSFAPQVSASQVDGPQGIVSQVEETPAATAQMKEKTKTKEHKSHRKHHRSSHRS